MEKRNENISQIHEAEKHAFQTQQKVEQTYEDDVVIVNKSDELRKQRNQEAQELISRRTIDARSIFEQNTVAGQMKKTPEKPVRNSLNKLKHEDLVLQNKNIEEIQSDDDSEQYSTIKRSPKDVKVDQSPLAKEIEVIQNEFALTDTNNLIKQENVEPVIHITEQQLVDEVIYQDFSAGPGLQARALYDYQAGKFRFSIFNNKTLLTPP